MMRPSLRTHENLSRLSRRFLAAPRPIPDVRSDGVDMRGDAQPVAVDQEARFVAFYDAAVGDVFRYFHRATAGDRGLAEDLTQETFMASVKAFSGGQPDAFTMPWIIGVARHKLVDHYRRQSREQRKLVLVWNAGSRDDPATSLQDLTEAESMQMLRALPDMHRVILALRYVDDLPVAEVARLIGRSVSATQSMLVRARASLEQNLQESHDA
jgi:RNA polymerase sigma-70 factor, ECF subfamily